MKKYLYMALAFNLAFIGILMAQDNETVVYGAAATPNGGENIAIVTQPADGGNPLGNPIVGKYQPPRAYNAADALTTPENLPASSSPALPPAAADIGHPQGRMLPNPAIEEAKQQGEFADFLEYENRMLNANLDEH
ncbi:MAG: hypothetical protein IJ184_03870 [Alphaproteobacteria bacterium]|nr:hypothetical protein [Alphaproteobacteria bacterium]